MELPKNYSTNVCLYDFTNIELIQEKFRKEKWDKVQIRYSYMHNNKKKKHAQLAYEKLRDFIITGQKLPGTRLIPAELEEQIGLGRSPIREALLELAQYGLVLIEPYKGAIVAYPPSFEEIKEIFEIRCLLEGKASEATVSNISEESIVEMEKLHNEMCSISKPIDCYFELNRQFHMILYSKSELEVLLGIIKQLIDRVQTFRIRYPFEPSDFHIFNEEHQSIINALRAGDARKVKSKNTDNIWSGFESLLKVHGKIISSQNWRKDRQ